MKKLAIFGGISHSVIPQIGEQRIHFERTIFPIKLGNSKISFKQDCNF